MMTFRKLTTLFFAVASATFIGAAGASAQGFMGGAGLVYTDLDPFSIGVQVNASMAIEQVPSLRIAGDVTYYLPETESSAFGGEELETSVGLIGLNLNAQYHFLTNESLSVYGLGGLNYSRISMEIEMAGASESDSNSETGLNVGAGLEYPVTFGLLYGEIKLVTGDADRMVFGGGVRIPLGS